MKLSYVVAAAARIARAVETGRGSTLGSRRRFTDTHDLYCNRIDVAEIEITEIKVDIFINLSHKHSFPLPIGMFS